MPCRRVLLFFVSASSGQNSTSEQKLSSMVLFDGYLCTASEACPAFFFFLSIISKLALVCIPPTISFGESRRVSARNLNQRLKKKKKLTRVYRTRSKKKKKNQCFGAHL